jgi:precorrin-8X/cobalt-precorrin-8 methylmutase
MTRASVHPIEQESFAILRSRIDLSALPPLSRAVTERVIHSSADLGYGDELVLDEASLQAAQRALHDGAPVVADVQMVAAGITTREVVCRVREATAHDGLTRSAAAIRMAYDEVGPGAVWVIGCAPTALFELIDLGVEPALVIGLPVGFVGAAESKAALRESGLPAVSNHSEKGGSAVASAALNALLYDPAEGDLMRPALLIIGHGTKSEAGCAQFASWSTVCAGRRPTPTWRAGFLELAPPPIQDAVAKLVAVGTTSSTWCRSCWWPPGTARATSRRRSSGRSCATRGWSSGTAGRWGRTRTCWPRPSSGWRRWCPRAVADHCGGAGRPGRHRPGRQRRGRQDRPAAARGPRDRHGRDRLHQPGRAVRPGRAGPRAPARLRAGRSCCRGSCSPACCRTASPGRPAEWAQAHPEVEVLSAGLIGPGEAWPPWCVERWAEIDGGDLRMNCDTCAYRVAVPGFEAEVGAAQRPHDHPDDPAHPHGHGHGHDHGHPH